VNANDAVPTNIEEVCELSKSPVPVPPVPPPPNILTNTPSEPEDITSTPEPVK
jgi:hypothetical protein